MGDEFEHVTPGERVEFSSRSYNAMVDAARAHREGRQGLGVPREGRDQEAGAVLSYNDEGSDCPMYSVVELTDGDATILDRVEFCKPGNEKGVGVYGIVLEPIPNEELGMVAWSGGPYELKASIAVAAAGILLGPSDGSWEAIAGSVWVATSRKDSDGQVSAAFFASGAGDVETVDTLGVDTEGTEAAYEDTWTAGAVNGLEVYIMCRVGYFHAGDQILYGYIRKFTYDNRGNLYSVSAETRIEIDVPEAHA